jgi:hypothetical protein
VTPDCATRTAGRTARRTARRTAGTAGCIAAACLAAAMGTAALAPAQGASRTAAAVTASHRDGPPPAHTGGFGEPTCHGCHFDSALDRGPGRVALEGVPDTYQPGTIYLVTVTLSHPGTAAAGFQLAARFEDGTQAGVLQVAGNERSRTAVTAEAGIQYAHHLEDGTTPSSPGSTRWIIQWTAPLTDRGSVVFHVAANAANDDWSPFGDFIYSASARASP